MEIKIDRHTWWQFCQESEFTDEEWADWRRAANELTQDDDLYDFVSEATQEEWQARQEAESQSGWCGLVAQADARRRLMRAELRAWREYHKQEG